MPAPGLLPIRLTDLLGVNANSLGQAIAESRPLLNEHRRMIAASTLQFSTATELRDFVSSGQSVPARAQAPHLFAAPELTGMPRTDLIALIEWVRPVLNTRSERHRHRRRGGEHLPGAPGGVFTLRITGDEPVVATAGDQRKPGTQGTLAELGYVAGAPSATSLEKSDPSGRRSPTPSCQPLPDPPTPMRSSTRLTGRGHRDTTRLILYAPTRSPRRSRAAEVHAPGAKKAPKTGFTPRR